MNRRIPAAFVANASFLFSFSLPLPLSLFSPAFWPRGRPRVVSFIQALKTRVCQKLCWSQLKPLGWGFVLPAWKDSSVLRNPIKHQCNKPLSPNATIGDGTWRLDGFKTVITQFPFYVRHTGMANMFLRDQISYDNEEKLVGWKD